MIEGGDGAGFGQETIERAGVLARLARDDLQRHATVDGHVLAEKHVAHAALAQQGDEAIFAEVEGAASGEQLARLPTGDQLLLDQTAGGGFGVGVWKDRAAGSRNLSGRQQSALREDCEEFHPPW